MSAAILLTVILIGTGWNGETPVSGKKVKSLNSRDDWTIYEDTLVIPDSIPAMPGTRVEVPLKLINHARVVGFGALINYPEGLEVDTILLSSEVESLWGSADYYYSVDVVDDHIISILAYSNQYYLTHYLPEGNYDLCYIYFNVSEDLEIGELCPLVLVDSICISQPCHYTALAVIIDSTSLEDRYPITEDGSVYLTYTTQLPVIQQIPDTSILEGSSLIFSVTAYDPDGDSLTLWAEDLPENASFPTVSGDSVVTGTFAFYPDTTQGDSIYRIVFLAQDQYGATTEEEVFIHVINVVNMPPHFTTEISDTCVSEGDTLVLLISAEDPEGGPVTLTTGSLPPNASFVDNGDGTGTFTLAPDFEQGPDTVVVTFYATDSLGSTSSMDVTIEIKDVPYDFLIADTTGGLPGAGGVALPIWLTSQWPIYGIQFDLAFDGDAFKVDSIIKRGDYPNFVLYYNELAPGTLRVVMMSYSLDTIPTGHQALMDVYFTIMHDATPGKHPVVPFNAVEATDIYGNWLPLITFDGYINVDILGDVNLDGEVNVADVVFLLSYLLGYVDLMPRQLAAADANQDDNLNVGDVVAIIYIILNRTRPPHRKFDEEAPLANLLQEFDGNYLILKLNSYVSVGGIQVDLAFDPSVVQLMDPQIGDSLDGFTMSYRFFDDKMRLIIYSLSGDSIPPGEHAFVRIPVSGNAEDVVISEAYVADPWARMLPLVVGNSETRQLEFAIRKLSPIPFCDKLTIEFSLPERSPVRIDVFNSTGRLIRELTNTEMKAGIHTVTWDGRDAVGAEVAQGVYFIRLSTSFGERIGKVMLLKRP